MSTKMYYVLSSTIMQEADKVSRTALQKRCSKICG